MAFMQQYVTHGDYFEVDTTAGTEIVPADVIGRTCATDVSALLNYLEGTPLDDDELCPIKTGWLSRMTAPGYMDCTAWSAHATEKEAIDYLTEMYGDDEND